MEIHEYFVWLIDLYCNNKLIDRLDEEEAAKVYQEKFNSGICIEFRHILSKRKNIPAELKRIANPR